MAHRSALAQDAKQVNAKLEILTCTWAGRYAPILLKGRGAENRFEIPSPVRACFALK